MRRTSISEKSAFAAAAWQSSSGYTQNGKVVAAGEMNSEGGVVGARVNHRAGGSLIYHRSARCLMLGFLVLFLSTVTIYIQFTQSRATMPIPIPTPETLENIDLAGNDGKYGVNVLPPFTNLIQVENLDTQLVPATGKGRGSERLVIIGDVHGMKNELVKLLEKVGFNKKKDHLILVGDLITKGPDSLGVIDLAMSLQASAVRGNHEDRVLLAYDEMKSKQVKLPGPFEDPEKAIDDDMEELSYSHGNYEDRSLARALNKTQVEWLKKLPVILRVGKLEGMGEVVVVHAGLVAGTPLESQDPFQAMNMRTINMHSRIPSDSREGTSWTKLWNIHQKQLPESERSTVIYGHDSKRGLQIKEYTKGIDTGCRKGDELTALIIEGGASDVHQHIIQLKCHKQKR